MKVGSLFSGIGGLDLGLEQAGMNVAWFAEPDKFCRRLLADKWPDVPNYGDVRTLLAHDAEPVELLAGGDPCPSRSLARGGRAAIHPDLAGWFLAVVGRLRPRWVVRENVPAPDVVEFGIALDYLGYGVAAVELDAADFTSQSRRRQFLVGCPRDLRAGFERSVLDAADDFGFDAAVDSPQALVAACLTSHPSRMAADESYVFEDGRGLRLLSCAEAEALQGFPRGWTAAFSRSRSRQMVGNAVTVPVARWVGERIMEVDTVNPD